MKKFGVLISLLLLLASCDNQEEPAPEVFSQVAEISNGTTTSRQITYDKYGRAVKYTVSYPGGSVNATYSYPSDNTISIHTEDVAYGTLGISDIVREYDDEIHLENGRASYCDGVFSSNEFGTPFQKKYRHEFTYTSGNHLNVVKWTEWNRQGDEWALDRPWTWENYYIWENGNLTEIEDFSGKTTPFYRYKYSYSTTSGIQNITDIHYGRHQYYPLQLGGILGAQPENLISGVQIEQADVLPVQTRYEYMRYFLFFPSPACFVRASGKSLPLGFGLRFKFPPLLFQKQKLFFLLPALFQKARHGVLLFVRNLL